MLHGAADPPDSAVHVLDDFGVGQRAAQFGQLAEAGDGQHLVHALADAAGNAGASRSPNAKE
jgi:hypothetical protein